MIPQVTAPVVAEVVRNGFVESRHHGHVVALHADGTPALQIGEIDAPMFPRSSLKPLQALGLLHAGWRPADDEQLALACASHSGEPAHVAVVRRILHDAGLDDDALRNTPDPDRLRQNCSGKHAAMLATCVANGWGTDDYLDPQHPVQLAIRRAVEELCNEQVARTAVDGCGAPLFAISLRGLARGFAAATSRTNVGAAMRAHPFLVGGTGRDVTSVMQAVQTLTAKDGAEGVYAAATTDGRAAAVKIADGAARARGPVLAAALDTVDVEGDLTALRDVPVLGHGAPVGMVRAVRFS